jgi:hypothetical protein
MRWIFERLQTTPGQERAVVGALDQLRSNRTLVENELQQTRQDIAQAVRSGLVDDSALDETFARHDRLLAQLRVSFVEAAKTVVEALDERQRAELGAMLERRGWFARGPRWGGPRWGDPDRAWI